MIQRCSSLVGRMADAIKAARTRHFLCLVTLIAATVLATLHYGKRYQHFAVHEPGVVYRSAWLEPDALVDVIERYQIRTVLNLCHPGEMGEERSIIERQAVAGAGARLVELPIPAKSKPDFECDSIQPHLDALNNPDNFPLLVHCQHGVTRTAKVLMIYDMVHRRMSADESLKAMPLFGRKQPSVEVRAFARQLDENRETILCAATPASFAILRR